jgi:hypothetical protein
MQQFGCCVAVDRSDGAASSRNRPEAWQRWRVTLRACDGPFVRHAKMQGRSVLKH